MPTGYTADVGDGKVTEFPDFALACARAFGALITMRDDHADVEIPEELEPGAWYETNVTDAQVALEEAKAWTPEEATAAAQDVYDKDVAQVEESREKRAAMKVRYEAMLSEAQAWEPPSEEHVKMKEFMIEQLQSSIQFDCEGFTTPVLTPLDGPRFQAAQIKDRTEDLERAITRRQEENERVAGRNLWLRQLRESLGLVTA